MYIQDYVHVSAQCTWYPEDSTGSPEVIKFNFNVISIISASF